MLHRKCVQTMDTITNLGWNRIFDTADLFDGTIEIIPVAHHDAHSKLCIWLKKIKKKPYILLYIILPRKHYLELHKRDT